MQQAPQAPSLFAELPDDLDGTWQHGFIVGGMAHHTDPFTVARAYVNAGDVLTEHPTDKGEPWEVAYPVLFLYRHAIELYLKAIVQPQQDTHDLSQLTLRFIDYVTNELGETVPDWFQQYLREFSAIDPRSTAFRYVDGRATRPLIESNEAWVEFAHLREVVGALVAIFERLPQARPAH